MILAHHGMLECGSNYKGTMSELCRHCEKNDDENHRLNECKYLEAINRANNDEKTNFQNVHSNDDVVLTEIIERLDCIWEFCCANGKMKNLITSSNHINDNCTHITEPRSY